MAACMVAACAATAAQAAAEAQPQLGGDHCWAVSNAAAASALPEALSALVAAEGWQYQRRELLQRVVAALQRLQAAGVPGAGCLLRRCLLAVRHLLPEELWAALGVCLVQVE